jgi:hypothetical protein
MVKVCTFKRISSRLLHEVLFLAVIRNAASALLLDVPHGVHLKSTVLRCQLFVISDIVRRKIDWSIHLGVSEDRSVLWNLLSLRGGGVQCRWAWQISQSGTLRAAMSMVITAVERIQERLYSHCESDKKHLVDVVDQGLDCAL